MDFMEAVEQALLGKPTYYEHPAGHRRTMLADTVAIYICRGAFTEDHPIYRYTVTPDDTRACWLVDDAIRWEVVTFKEAMDLLMSGSTLRCLGSVNEFLDDEEGSSLADFGEDILYLHPSDCSKTWEVQV